MTKACSNLVAQQRGRTKPSALGGALIEISGRHAKEVSAECLNVMLDFELSNEEIEREVRGILKEEIRVACAEWGVALLRDQRILSNLRVRFQGEAGRRSGAVRAERGKKAKFLKWALEVNAQNPRLSKNDVAERYAAGRTDVSVTTLRRYLADIPITYVD